MKRPAFFVFATLAILAMLAIPAVAWAHDLRPALLSITQQNTAPGREEFEVEFRMPIEMAIVESPTAVMPAESARIGDTTHSRAGDTAVEHFRVRVPGGLAGRRLGVHFPRGAAGSEVLIRFVGGDGRTRTGRLVPGGRDGDVYWSVPVVPTSWHVAKAYLLLGLRHILTGIDHLAFVLGLVMLTPAFGTLWKSITAFTVAHSVSLGLAALGLLRVPQAPVEATIALSILLIAREVWLKQHGRSGSHGRRPWPMAFVFGLLHGLGFAGALAEVGLPETDIPAALLTFNVGVEMGQLAFVLLLLGLGRVSARSAIVLPSWTRLAPTYAIGTLAAFWCFDRVAGF